MDNRLNKIQYFSKDKVAWLQKECQDIDNEIEGMGGLSCVPFVELDWYRYKDSFLGTAQIVKKYNAGG